MREQAKPPKTERMILHMLKNASIFIATITFLFTSNSAYPKGKAGYCPDHSYHGGHFSEDPHGNLFLDYAETLKLTDSQVTKLNKLRLEAEKKKVELEHRLWELHAQMNEAAHGDKPDRKLVEKKAEEIGKTKGELIK